MTNDELKRNLSDSEILLLTIIGEAEGEPIEGQVGVGHVILKRAQIRNQSIKDACLAPKQFSCWNDNDPNRVKLLAYANKMMQGNYSILGYEQIQWVVDGLMTLKLKNNVKGYDYYMTTSLYNSDKRPGWAANPKGLVVVRGNHTFFTV